MRHDYAYVSDLCAPINLRHDERASRRQSVSKYHDECVTNIMHHCLLEHKIHLYACVRRCMMLSIILIIEKIAWITLKPTEYAAI